MRRNFFSASKSPVADVICQSYYPIFHGPLTAAQAAIANPGGKPIEENPLIAAANNIGKPILILETGEHYENGFQSNDPWYTPTSTQLQNQFLLDLRTVVTARRSSNMKRICCVVILTLLLFVQGTPHRAAEYAIGADLWSAK
ncbi:MAG: hypothetical protein WBL63_12465 [Candidatus Acidiferrum sp.]